MPRDVVFIVQSDDPTQWFFSPPEYRESFLAEWKDEVPKDFRRWDSFNTRWFVDEDFLGTAMEILMIHFPEWDWVEAPVGSEAYEEAVDAYL